MNPMRKLLEVVCRGVAPVGDVAGDDTGIIELRNRVARLLRFTRRGRSEDERVYIEGTWRLKAIITCPELDTGFAFSRYTVKLSSLHRISG